MTRIKTTSYHVKGQGPALVLIRGLGLWSVHWHGFDDILSQYFKVITIDNRGLGPSPKNMTPLVSVEDLATDIRDILEQEKVANAHILGTSFGGMIGASFALKYPQYTNSLIMVGSSVGRSGHLRLTPRATFFLIKASFQRSNIFMDLARLLLKPHASEEQIKKLAREWSQHEQDMARQGVTILSQLIAALRFNKWEELNAIKRPTLVLVGSQDQFVPKSNSKFLHSKIPQSQFVELEEAGHEPHIDQPVKVLELIRSFTAQNSTS